MACRDVAVGFGYASGQQAITHVGLGPVERCDIEVMMLHGQGRIEKRGAAADQRVVLAKE